MLNETKISSGQKRSKAKRSKEVEISVEKQYKVFFVPTPSPLWQRDDNNYSLEQPSPFKWIPNETTYGIDVTLCPVPNA